MTLKINDDDKIMDIGIVVIAIIIVVLKLCGVITMPWIWIVSPFWIPGLIGLLLMVLFISIITIRGIFNLIKERKNERN